MDLSVCRTCLETSENMSSILAWISINNTGVCLRDILEDFYDYKIDLADGMPQTICCNCVYQLTITHSFKTLINKSLSVLKECVSHTYYGKGLVNDRLLESDSDDIVKIAYEAENRSCNEKIVCTDNMSLFYCVKCKDKFPFVGLLHQHCREKHKRENDVGRACEFCDEKFSDFKSLIAHTKQHLAPFVCERCWESFLAAEEFENHSCKTLNNDKCKGPEKTYQQCDHCGKSYPQNYFKVHLQIHDERRRYSCSHCPQKFKVRCSLNSHVLWKHDRSRKHKCNVCSATFISASSRSTHIRKHHLHEKKHACETCGKLFFSKSQIARHLLSHTGVKNFHCHLCTKSYQTRHGLNVHLRAHNNVHSAITGGLNLTNL